MTSTFTPQFNSAFNNALRDFKYRMDSDETDLHKVLDQFHQIITDCLSSALQEHHAIRAGLVICLKYHSKKFSFNEPMLVYLRTKLHLLYQEKEIPPGITAMYKEIATRNENFIRNESNLEITEISFLSVLVGRFQPLAGAHFAELPPFLKSKKAIINIQNKDTRCFGYAILAALKNLPRNAERAHLYLPFFQEQGLHNLQYPVHPQDVPEIEQQLHLKINVFSFYDDEGKGRYPLYVSKNEEYTTEIDLLYWNEHYAWIKNFSRFIYDLSPAHRPKFFCKRCFGLFLNSETFHRHHKICDRPDFDSMIFLFPSEGTTLKFHNSRHQLKVPFIIYADFESLLLPEDAPIPHANQVKRRRTTLIDRHVPCAAGIYVVSANAILFPPTYESFTGENVVQWFLNRLFDISENIKTILSDPKRLVMTQADWATFNASSFCWICKEAFDLRKPETKVRDHDHLTGQFRGAAHSECNLQLQQTRKLPVFLHNFRGYDAHIITRALDAFPQMKISVIGQSYEKYLTLSFGQQIIFKDSYQFLGFSLAQLTKELLSSGSTVFAHLRKQFPNITDEEFKLLLRKGVYPYEYMNDWEKLKLSKLPSKESFYSHLGQSDITDEDYNHAKLVWEKFACTTMNDYQDLYLKTDVLLLADIFENFREFSITEYRLDAAHYVSSPQLSWDAMLLFTNCEMELISDSKMFNMIDSGIRGGVSMISHRYAKANNPEMGPLYNTAEELSYIIYLDANNLYGWAMSQPMPIRNFKWLSNDEWKVLDWLNIPDDASIGYILECDLLYPPTLHDLHNEFPLAPEKRYIQSEMLSKTQLRILSHYMVPKSSLKVQKLIPHFLPRKNYVIHYRNLKFYLEQGLQLVQVTKVLQFEQSAWLKPYIIKNQDLRARVKTDFEKSIAKLFNNSVYGKTCENQKKRSDIKLVNTEKACKRLIEKPHMRGFKIFKPQLAAIDLRKTQARIDKPFYVGFTVLELSKLHMFKFHYCYIKAKFADQAKLLFTDTDSLMYWIRGRNPYEQFLQDRAEYFDFASYPKTHPCYDLQNNKVIGKFKDEANGAQITEFVGLRPKMYSFLINKETPEEKHTAKGIQMAVSKKLKHADFLSQLNNPHENRFMNWRIGSKLHELYTIQTEKRGLCSFDDKRVLMEDGISSLAYGHYGITEEHIDIGDPSNTQQYQSNLTPSQRPRSEPQGEDEEEEFEVEADLNE